MILLVKYFLNKVNTKQLLLLFVFLMALVSARADEEVRLVGTGKQVVQVGERFRIVYELNAEGRAFTEPAFGTKLQKLSGPNTSTSSSIQIINGNYQQSYTQSYTFVMVATAEGDVTIPPATVNVKGKTYQSNSIKIKIVKGSGKQQGISGGSSQKSSGDGSVKNDDVFIRAVVSKKNPYLGEQLILTYKIYFRINISSPSFTKEPSLRGFWAQDLLKDRTSYIEYNETVNGQQYHVAELKKYALFPQKSGKITIDPVDMKIVAQVRTQSKRRRSNDPFEDFFNDPFFNRNVRNVEVPLRSNAITLNVKPLPQKGKPEGFSGAVGNFSFTDQLDNNSLKANEALTLTIGLSGKGNLELINPPEVHFPSDFETYEPKTSSKIVATEKGVSGRKKFEYLAIPRNAGDFVIEPVSFSFFNPRDKQYHTYTTERYTIHVEKGDASSPAVSYSSSAQEDIRYIGQDIRHIKTGDSELRQANDFLFASTTYYLLVSLPALILLIFVALWKKREKQRGDVGMMKTRKANKVARGRLQKAAKFMKAGNDKEFYDEIAQALWGYIADKFGIPQAVLSIDTVKETLMDKGAGEQVVDNFVNTLNNIEFARFAPGDSGGKIKSVYEEAMHAITQAEKAFK